MQVCTKRHNNISLKSSGIKTEFEKGILISEGVQRYLANSPRDRSYPIENNRGRIGGRWWAAVVLRGALPEAHRGGAGEMSALSWEISTAAHRVPPKI